MNTYRNKRTGTLLQTESKVTGDNWELVKKPKQPKDQNKQGGAGDKTDAGEDKIE